MTAQASASIYDIAATHINGILVPLSTYKDADFNRDLYDNKTIAIAPLPLQHHQSN